MNEERTRKEAAGDFGCRDYISYHTLITINQNIIVNGKENQIHLRNDGTALRKFEKKNYVGILWAALALSMVILGIYILVVLGSAKKAVTTEQVSYIFNEDFQSTSLSQGIPEKGKEFSAKLSPGRYVGGQHLPVGTYEISLVSDEYAGTILLTDTKNGVFESAFMAAEEEYGGERTVRDYQLFEGGVLEIGSGEILVTASTQNAQMDTLQEGMPNPLTESFDLTYGSRLEVGVDIPAGTYDARHLSGLGTLEITDQDSGGYSAVMLTDSLTGDERAKGYRNLLLEEGQILSVTDYSTENFQGQLVPSEVIYQ